MQTPHDSRRSVGLHRLVHPPPVHDGQHQVQDDDVGAGVTLREQIQSLPAIHDCRNAIALLLEGVAQRFSNVLVVFHYEDRLLALREGLVL